MAAPGNHLVTGAVPGSASADAAATPAADLVTAAQAVYDRFCALYSLNDFAHMDSIWDQSQAPFYIAEESPILMQSWAELRHYWEVSMGMNGRSRIAVKIVGAKSLAPDTMLAMFVLDWTIHLKSLPKPYGGSNRGFAVLRSTAAGWKLTAHCEAPPAAITWVKSMYESLGARHLGQ